MPPTAVPAATVIGQKVLFYSTNHSRPDIGRVGWVTGAGATNTEPTANLTFFHHPVFDVLNKRLPPVHTARHVPVYDSPFLPGERKPPYYAHLLKSREAPAAAGQQAPDEPRLRHATRGELPPESPPGRAQQDLEPGDLSADEMPEGEEAAHEETVNISLAAVQKLVDDPEMRIVVLQVEETGCTLGVDLVGGTLNANTAKGHQVARVCWSEEPPRGYRLEVITKNGRGFQTILEGVTSKRKTDPKGSVHRILDILLAVCQGSAEAPSVVAAAALAWAALRAKNVKPKQG